MEEISEVKITFYRQSEFLSIFNLSGLQFHEIHKSLDLKFNQQ